MDDEGRFEEIGLGTRLRLLLSALDGEVQQLYDAAGEPFRPRFYPVVQALRAYGSSTVGGLAARTGVSQPAMTQTLAEMRARGLLATDTPGRRVCLSETGEALCDRLEPMWRAVATAAADLDRELPAPLGATIAVALARLAEKPFAARIRAAMERP